MNWLIVEENWPAFVERIGRRWPATQENDLLDIDGDRSRFATYLSKVHDLTRNEANEEIDVWLMGQVPADVVMSEQMDNRQISASGRHIPPNEDVYSEDAGFGDDQLASRPVGRTN